MRTLTTFFVLGLFALPVQAQEANPAQTIAPLVDDLTLTIIRLDLSRVKVETVIEALKDLGLPKGVDLAQVKVMLTEGLTVFRQAGGKEIFLMQRLAPQEGEPCFIVPLAAGADAQALRKLVTEILTKGGTPPRGFRCEVHGKFLLIGNEPVVEGVKKVQPVERPEIAKAFAAIEGEVSQALLVLSPTLRRALQETMPPTLPPELGGGNLREVFAGFSWAAVGFSLTPRLSAHLLVQTKDAAAAKGTKQLVDNALQALVQNQEVKKTFPDIEKLAALLKPTVQGDRLKLDLDAKAVILPWVQARFAMEARAKGLNNLKQLALAMHNYHDTHKTFPPFASHDKQGKPLLSWRVHLLPYLEQEELYKQFRLDEPWDSEHNKKLIPKMPGLFQSPLQRKGDQGKTCYLVPVGKDTIFGGSEGRKIQEITDGTSNTIMIVETNDDSAVIWTKPEDFPAGAKDALERLLRPKAEGFLTAFADGSVRMLPPTLSLETLRALFTRNGGEAVNLP